ncbi:MFS transporter [Deinococcus sp. YIM 77859]|uniref:MFS transporter n=1 Tax=Deinococcus sp. YIM 77859 TaxID=1540221 RepID=UPI0005597B19|nr:MFS transporter [Deinococcus sp. YIM 77859]
MSGAATHSSWSANLHLLRQRDFAILWAAQTFSGFGDNIFRVAQVALLLKLGGSAAALSALLLVSVVPGLLLALLGGALADRVDRRRLLIAANIVRGILMAVVAGLVMTGAAQLAHLYILALLYGGISAFTNPAFDALLPGIVKREQLQNANAMFLLGDNVAAIAGPALGGLLLTVSGVAGAAVLNAVSFFVLVVGLLYLHPAPLHRDDQGRSSLFRDIGKGLQYARSNGTLLGFLTLFAAINISGATLAVSLPLYVTEQLDLSPGMYGVFLTTMNIGILLGITIIGAVRVRHRGRLITGSIFAMGAFGYLLLGASRELWIGLLAVAIIDGLSMVPNILYPAWVQASVPDEYRGRVFGLTGVVSYSLVPVGFVLAGAATTTFGPAGAIMAAGVLLVAVALGSLLVPALRQLD